jgi:hypothetical protein
MTAPVQTALHSHLRDKSNLLSLGEFRSLLDITVLQTMAGRTRRVVGGVRLSEGKLGGFCAVSVTGG